MTDKYERIVDKQVRLVLERQCRELADVVKSKVPAGVGYLVFLADFGEEGNLAYFSSVERDGAIKLVQGWLDSQDANHPAEGWQMAAAFLQQIAAAIGFKGEPAPDKIIAECRRLAEAKA